MPKLTRIYTRTGDDGTAALGTKERVSKDSQRVEAYGELDELNSTIGVALATGLCDRVSRSLRVIQNELFILGSDLAYPHESAKETSVPRIEARHVLGLETLIDELLVEVGMLDNFVLPGGSLGASLIHVSRTTCRRAERRLVKLAREEQVSAASIQYLNRLSDALFVLARYENREKGIDEPLWDSHA